RFPSSTKFLRVQIAAYAYPYFSHPSLTGNFRIATPLRQAHNLPQRVCDSFSAGAFSQHDIQHPASTPSGAARLERTRAQWSSEVMTREPMREETGEIVVPLLEEEISVAKQQVVTGRTRISTVTREREELVNELLMRERVEVERAPVGKFIDRPPEV